MFCALQGQDIRLSGSVYRPIWSSCYLICANISYVCMGMFYDVKQRLFIWLYLSLVMGKLAFCISENKDADQLRSNCAADQRIRFR